MVDTQVTSGPVKNVNLALQGGGAHGAFVWGVLDCLLEDGRLEIEAISATSAGAMNAVVLASGMAIGGREAARNSLHDFWREVSRADLIYDFYSPFNQWIQALKLSPEYHPFHAAIHAFTHTLPPNLLNPFNYNPLRPLLLKVVDFERLNAPGQAPQLFLNATNVRTGKIKVFQTPSIKVESVLASACLPPYFQAVEVDGEHYWDGGYLGNPALFPLIYRKGARDIIVVQVTAIRREALPASAADVLHRINEISFNSSLMREMRAVAFATRLIDGGELDAGKHSRIYMHWIGDDHLMAQLGTATQFHPEWSLLCKLRDAGRQTAMTWLEKNFEQVGCSSTLDLADMFL
ncbi:MAG: patatin-like phospholipase family protein [Bradyrhizobium sp.]|uniref:patatin-like phospholipase family protein n=1 Tax=Bradyrhizobium sp. TaxID=376 RepID=UPI0025C141B1|nr:patatin-like phospholipase family protein [Bradyrhizobium sp.]MBI5265138.1 patatin-like phospholipase family protein [Bradyrhizobium sp.]